MPLATKETLALDSHRPLTYETQHLRNTNYNIKTPLLEDFITRESRVPDEQEDRIRSITATVSDEGGDFGKHSKSPL